MLSLGFKFSSCLWEFYLVLPYYATLITLDSLEFNYRVISMGETNEKLPWDCRFSFIQEKTVFETVNIHRILQQTLPT